VCMPELLLGHPPWQKRWRTLAHRLTESAVISFAVFPFFTSRGACVYDQAVRWDGVIDPGPIFVAVGSSGFGGNEVGEVCERCACVEWGTKGSESPPQKTCRAYIEWHLLLLMPV
jgi:hypothetical protein